jgi:deoxyribose-phosphate aldolase
MENILSKFGYTPDLAEIDRILSNIQSNLENWAIPQNMIACIASTDLTSLKSEDTEAKNCCIYKKVNDFKKFFPNYEAPASICVYPNFGKTVKDNLNVPNVHVTTVSGCFPSSQSFLDVKLLECKKVVENGTDEVDIVLALNKFLANDIQGTAEEIQAIRKEIGNNIILKVILETGALTTPEKIATASFLAMESGADFIKTSTGKQEPAATPMAAIVMCQCIKIYFEKTGKKIGFKPAGGISSAKDALCYYAIVDTILGKDWLTPQYFRLGASRLVNNLLSELEQKTVTYF